MSKERTFQAEIGGYISTVLRKHSGKGPTSFYVTINPVYHHPFPRVTGTDGKASDKPGGNNARPGNKGYLNGRLETGNYSGAQGSGSD